MRWSISAVQKISACQILDRMNACTEGMDTRLHDFNIFVLAAVEWNEKYAGKFAEASAIFTNGLSLLLCGHRVVNDISEVRIRNVPGERGNSRMACCVNVCITAFDPGTASAEQIYINGSSACQIFSVHSNYCLAHET